MLNLILGGRMTHLVPTSSGKTISLHHPPVCGVGVRGYVI